MDSNLKIFFSLALVILISIYVGFFREGKFYENSLSVLTQEPNLSAIVDNISIQKSGFVVLYDDEGGLPNNIIGNSYILDKGEYTDLVVNFNRASKNGEKKYGILYEDDGDRRFSPVDVIVARDANGDPIIVPFTIQR